MKYQLTTLHNGVRVATCEMPHMASVSVGLWAAVGSRYEAARLNGAAHFLEHLLFKGTKRRSARQISGEVEALGGYLEAFTSEDHTCYYAKAEAEHLEGLGDVLGDIYIHSKLPAVEVERERGVIREEILMYRDQPAQVAEEILAETLWPRHPLGRPLAGTLATVAGLRRDQLLAFWQAGYHAGTTILAVAGRVTHEDVLARAARPLLDLPSGRVPGFSRWTQKNTASAPPVAIVHQKETEQTQLLIGFTAPGRYAPDRFAARMLCALLGEKMDSRLFQSLRERRGLCYSIQSEVSLYAETGSLTISAGLEAAQIGKALKLVQQEIQLLCGQPISDQELRETRGYLVGQHRLGLESTTSQMMWAGESLLSHGKIIDPERIRHSLETVTAAQVQEVAQRVLRVGFRALVAVGPLEARGADLLDAFRTR